MLESCEMGLTRADRLFQIAGIHKSGAMLGKAGYGGLPDFIELREPFSFISGEYQK